MKAPSSKELKEKITISIHPQLLEALDHCGKEKNLRSRSAIVEHFLLKSIANENKQRLEAETEAYYQSLTEKEKKEDRSWAKTYSHQAVDRFERK
jgi:metal-responsive CopG/Arc/MetJ family transcriptional regulator